MIIGACAVSASVSSLIPSVVGQFAGPVAVVDRVPGDLLDALAGVVDPRACRGVRHRLVVILGIAVCATLGGARSFTAIAEWGHDLTTRARDRLGIGRVAPSETVIRRTLQRIDPEVLDGCVCRAGSPRNATVALPPLMAVVGCGQ